MFEVGLRVCDIVVKKFTFAISSPDEFLLLTPHKRAKYCDIGSLYVCKPMSFCSLSARIP